LYWIKSISTLINRTPQFIYFFSGETIVPPITIISLILFPLLFLYSKFRVRDLIHLIAGKHHLDWLHLHQLLSLWCYREPVSYILNVITNDFCSPQLLMHCECLIQCAVIKPFIDFILCPLHIFWSSLWTLRSSSKLVVELWGCKFNKHTWPLS